MRGFDLSITKNGFQCANHRAMKTLLRLTGIALFMALLGFCVFGFIATFEPMSSFHRMIWRTAYGMAGFVSVAALVRLLHCQFRRWSRRHHW